MSSFYAFITGQYSWVMEHGEPKTFKDYALMVLAEHAFVLSMFGWCFLLAALPFVIWTVLHLELFIELIGGGALTITDTATTVSTYFLGLIPCILIIHIVLPGLYRVARMWTEQSDIPMWGMFFKGIADNLKQSMAIGLLYSVLLFSGWEAFLISCLNESTWTDIIFGLIGIVVILFTVSIPTMMAVMVTYDLPLLGVIRNGVILSVMYFLPCVGIELMTFIIWIVYGILCSVMTDHIAILLIVPLMYYLLGGGMIRPILVFAKMHMVFLKVFPSEGEQQ